MTVNNVDESFINKFKRPACLILMSAVCATSVFSAGAFSRQVSVNADDKTISTLTSTGDTFKILEKIGVEIAEGDKVERCDNVDGSLKLDVKRAFEVSVSKGDKVVKLKKVGGTVKDALDSSGIEMGENDVCNFSEDKSLEPGMNIIIGEKVRIKLVADGEAKEICVPVGTVESALKSIGFEILPEDIVNVDVTSQVYDGMEISVGRVTYREFSKIEDVPFKTVIKKSHLLDDSQRQISAQGKKGEKEVFFKETLVDGKVVNSEEISSRIVCEPVDEVIVEGTRKLNFKNDVQNALHNSSQNINTKGSRMVSGSATAYTASRGARTSTGAIPTQGVTVAVNPRIIPYGKRLSIKTTDGKLIWKGIAQDTGGALKSGSAVVDIFMNSKADCMRFGRKKVNVYFD